MLTDITQRFADDSAKAGSPRAEAHQEMMTEKAKQRYQGNGPHAHNQLLNGQRNGKRGATV